jgi:hypothetical protein
MKLTNLLIMYLLKPPTCYPDIKLSKKAYRKISIRFSYNIRPKMQNLYVLRIIIIFLHCYSKIYVLICMFVMTVFLLYKLKIDKNEKNQFIPNRSIVLNLYY